MESEYTTRIEQLKRIANGSELVATDQHDNARGEYFYAGTNEFCKAFASHLNEFRDLEFEACDPRVSGEFSRFKRPDWQEVPFDLDIARNAVRGRSRFYRNASPATDVLQDKWEADADKRWQRWLSETFAMRAKGEIKMWIADLDIDGDGVIDTLARVQYGQASMRPITECACIYTYSSLWMLKSRDEETSNLFNEALGKYSDVIIDSKTNHAYKIDWSPNYYSSEQLSLAPERNWTVRSFLTLSSRRHSIER